MVFSSLVFLFLFMPSVLVVYHIVFFPVNRCKSPSWKRFWTVSSNLFLLLASLLFYFWGEKWLVLVLLASTMVNYACGLVMGEGGETHSTRTFRQKAGLTVSLLLNLGTLGFFKYFNFGIDNYNAMVGAAGLNSLLLNDVVRISLPIGISFYTFQSMSYTIDVYLGKVKPTRNYIDFACYVAMFPQLVAGPIVRYCDVAAQLASRVVNIGGFASGCSRFIIGLGKKVLIANTLAVPADAVFAIPYSGLTPGLAWLGAVCYTLQIYFDFSGYSDMAIGLGRMFGFSFLENFNYPYIARSVRDFWRRWHISLSTWFRDYLYIPLGGSRRSYGRVYFNLVLVFFLCGLWHGDSWTFVVWGLFHGLFLVMERIGLDDWLIKRASPVQHLYTMAVVVGGWVLFRSESFSHALGFLAAMSGFAAGDGIEYNLAMYLNDNVALTLVAGAVFSMPFVPWVSRRISLLMDGQRKGGMRLIYPAWEGAKLFILVAVMLLCSMNLASGTHNPFIYFRF